MKLRLLISLNLLWLALLAAWAQQQTAADFFHGGAMSYFSNNIPKALEVVTNGRAFYPDDTKLKKLEELLKQQQQQQQQQNQNQNDQQKQDQDKKDEQQQQKNQQQSKNQLQQQQNKSGEQKKEQGGQQQQSAAQMTPAQAQRLLDSQKGDESALVFRPAGKPEDQNRHFKDW